MSDQRFIKPLHKGFTERQRLALVLLAEEATELAQMAAKCLRFGLSARNPYEPEAGSNVERLAAELQDVRLAHLRFEQATQDVRACRRRSVAAAETALRAAP